MASSTNQADWRFLIDWDADGTFVAASDDVTAYVQSATWRLGMHQPWQLTADETTCTLVLNNASRRFSPENAASPLFGKMLPQRQIQITSQQALMMNDGVTPVIDNSGAIISSNEAVQWTGWIASIAPAPMQNAGPYTATIRGVGAAQFLKSTEISLPLLENVKADAILAAIYARTMFPPSAQRGNGHAIGVPGRAEIGVTTYVGSAAAFYTLDPGLTTYPYVGDNWDRFATAYDAVISVVLAEQGRLYFDRDGRSVYWNREHAQKHLTTEAVYSNNMQGLTYGYGEDVLNDARVTVYPRALSATATEVLWQLDQPLSLEPGETREVRARFGGADGQQIAGREITIPNTLDGSLVFSRGAVSVLKFQSDARTATMTLKNSGRRTSTISTLLIRGRKLTSWNAQEVSQISATSIASFGRQVERVDARLLSDTVYGLSIAQELLVQRKNPRGTVREVRFMNKDALTLNEMLRRTMGDCVSVSEPQTATSGDYTVIGETHEWREAGTLYQTRLALEPVPVYKAQLIGVAGRSEIGVTTIVGF